MMMKINTNNLFIAMHRAYMEYFDIVTAWYLYLDRSFTKRMPENVNLIASSNVKIL